MTEEMKTPRLSRTHILGLGGAALFVLGIAGGAGAVSLTRPAVEMAPATPVSIASLPQRDGIVTVRGKVVEVYGDRFTLTDGSGKTMIAAGRMRGNTIAAGTTLTVQGRYDDGQLRASFLINQDGSIDQLGHAGRHGPGGPGGPDGPGGPGGPGAGGPGRGRPGADGPPPPVGCAPVAIAPQSGAQMPPPPAAAPGATAVLPPPAAAPAR